MPVLSLRQVSFSYEDRKVLEDVNCDFYEGSIHVIAGPSGSGKSTLLQVINGLIPHVNTGDFEGRVLLRGEDISGVPANQRSKSIGLVMQDPEGQFCTFTVGEEIAFGLENHCVDPERMEEIIESLLDEIGLPDYKTRNLTDLSGGQKQKIAIASIMAMDPDILLMDEPTANLDPASREQVLNLIKSYAANGKCIILVEHNLEEIRQDIDRLLILSEDGRIIADESPDRIDTDSLGDVKYHLPRILWDNRPLTSIWSDGERISQKEKTDETVLSIRDLTLAYPIRSGLFRKQYDEPVIKGLNIDIHRGEFMVIAGENGAGKSTLLNAIFRVMPILDGEIVLYGRDVRKWNRKDLYEKMGLVFQNPELQFVTNQVDEELYYSFKQSEISKEEQDRRVSEMLSQFHLEEYAKKSPFILSQGQKRRLSVATMLLTGQQMLFLDEPTYGQDNENKTELITDMLKLNENGMSVVFVTHDEELIKRYAKRVVYLENGKFTLDGTADDYFAYVGERRRNAKLH